MLKRQVIKFKEEVPVEKQDFKTHKELEERFVKRLKMKYKSKEAMLNNLNDHASSGDEDQFVLKNKRHFIEQINLGDDEAQNDQEDEENSPKITSPTKLRQ